MQKQTMQLIDEAFAMTEEETKIAAHDALEQVRYQVETRTKLRLAQMAISNISDMNEARRILTEDHGAVFAADGVKFSLLGMTGKLTGPRGEPGTPKAIKNARKRERQARRAGRRNK